MDTFLGVLKQGTIHSKGLSPPKSTKKLSQESHEILREGRGGGGWWLTCNVLASHARDEATLLILWINVCI